jgi:hypothetical protein
MHHVSEERNLAYWKVLELSFHCTPLPYLVQEHHYSGFDAGGPTLIPETTIEDTAQAVRALVAEGAIRVADETHTLAPEEMEAVLSDPEAWDPTTGAFLVEVVNEPGATDLSSARPATANPHVPAS